MFQFPLVNTAGSSLLIAVVPLTASSGHAIESLSVNESLEAVVADLEAFVPAYMEQQGGHPLRRPPARARRMSRAKT